MEEGNDTLIDKIEKLIVGGQTIVLERLDKLEGGQRNLESGQRKLENGQQEIMQTVKAVHASLKNEIKVTALALDSKIEETKQELKGDISRIAKKLDEHSRQPAHA